MPITSIWCKKKITNHNKLNKKLKVRLKKKKFWMIRKFSHDYITKFTQKKTTQEKLLKNIFLKINNKSKYRKKKRGSNSVR